jgi:hypothetical protein
MNIKLQKLIKDTTSALSVATNPNSFFHIKSNDKEKLQHTLDILNELQNHLEIK